MDTKRGFADQSIGRTYRRLRILAAAALLGMPLLTAAVGFLYRHELQPSLSDYYFLLRDGGLPRTFFVMFLAFLGGVLYSYRGLDDRDNLIHNLAGLFAFGVALFPMPCDGSGHPDCLPGLFPFLHLPAAGLLYLSAVASVIYGGGPELRNALGRLSDPAQWLRRLRNIRIFSFTLMTLGIITFMVHSLFKNALPEFSWIFWVEYLGFAGFGIYWVRLMWLINDANSEGHRRLAVRSGPAADEGAGAPSVSRELAKAAPEIGEWSDIP